MPLNFMIDIILLALSIIKNLIRVDTITHTTSHAIGIETEKIKKF